MNAKNRISEICNLAPELTDLFRTRVRHYTIMEHTINVLNQFELYFSNDFNELDINKFRMLLILHDIGKPIAHKKGNRKNQYSETINIISNYKQILDINETDFILFSSLLCNDSLGLFMQGKLSLDDTYSDIVKQSRKNTLDINRYFYLLTVYYQCDIASYTEDAGGLKFLEYLFKYNLGHKIYSSNNKLLQFTDKHQLLYNKLLYRINSLEELPYNSSSNKTCPNIKFIKGNIFNTKAKTIVNTVNCVGVMGKGIALVFKLRYPLMFDIYKQYCSDKLIGIGKLWLYKGESDAPWVLNFPTKFHWKYSSKIEYLEKGLQKFVETYKEKGITSIAFPLLGTHNGGLDKNEVIELMNKYLSQCDIDIEIYEYDPYGADDLFELFKSRWNSIPMSDIKSITQIRTQKQIDTISTALNSDTVKSMINLIEYPSIGLKTMEKCFTLVMKGSINSTLFK